MEITGSIDLSSECRCLNICKPVTVAAAERSRRPMATTDIMPDTVILRPHLTRKAIEVDEDEAEGSYRSKMMIALKITNHQCGNGDGGRAVIDRLAGGVDDVV